MTTNFFEIIYELMSEGIDIKMSLRKETDNKLAVSLLPVHEKLDDNAKGRIIPFTTVATFQEFNEEFFTAIQKAIPVASGILSNMDAFLKSAKQAEKDSKMQAQLREKEKKEKEERKKKYDAQMLKVAELEKNEKWGEAIGAMPNPKDFPEQADDIKKKIAEMREKHGQLSLL